MSEPTPIFVFYPTPFLALCKSLPPLIKTCPPGSSPGRQWRRSRCIKKAPPERCPYTIVFLH
jgi:hypothetical protein